MDRRPLGRCGLEVSTIGFGAFKIGRNEQIRYPQSYPLPSDDEVDRLLNGVLDLGITLIDTAPAYGTSEARIGRAIGHRRSEFVVSTKVGEQFEGGRSRFDFSASGVRASVDRSRARLRTEVLDVVLVHSDGRDLVVQSDTAVVETLDDLRAKGVAKAIGFSGKTVEGARAALAWADVVMVEYHVEDRSHEAVMAEAHQSAVGVVVKKGLGSGRLDPAEAIPFVLRNPHVSSLVIGGLDLGHVRANCEIAATVGR